MTGTPIQLRDRGGRVVFEGTQDGGGGSQPENVRRLTVDVAAADLAEGPVTLYTPTGGEVAGPVYLYGVVPCNSSTAISIDRDEHVSGDDNFPPLAFWDSDLSQDSVAATAAASNLHQVPLTVGPVTAGFTVDGSGDTLQAQAWASGHVYAQFDHIIAAGHIWEADPGGTSGGSEPDFAANIGGTVTDNGITWTDNADATGGSATVSFDVCTPAAP